MTDTTATTDSLPLPETATTSGPPLAETGGILTVDLSAIVQNWRTLSQRAIPSECSAVIKANAYGCGLEEVAKALTRADCRTFFVADLGEARRLRAVSRDTTIYVLGGLMPNCGPAFAEISARPVIGSLVEMAEWDAFVAQSNWRGGFALHVDTGMNRLGLTIDEAAAAASRIRLENHGITLVMSHLACAEETDHPLNAKQIAAFRDIRLLYRGIPSSLSNSSGIFLSNAAHCDMVRPGVALYGVNPTPGRANPMKPVINLRAHILQVRNVQRGETVGYNAGWTAKRASRIAVVGVGYADGFLRSASASDQKPGGKAVVAGRLCPFAGRVSMDLIAIDITELPADAARRGDLVTLIGDEITVDDVAAAGNTIGYEVLTSIGQRYHRVYRGG